MLWYKCALYKFKGVLPHLTGHFSHFQNINILKVWSNSDQNLFTVLKNIKIEYFKEEPPPLELNFYDFHTKNIIKV